MLSKLKQLQQHLFQPVEIASLALYRMAFGLILFYEVIQFYNHGWIEKYYMNPGFYFTYDGFGWLSPLPGNGMHIFFLGLGILTICIFLGLFYRVATWLFFFGFTYIFLLDKTNYLNHFYLISLLSFILAIVPANRRYSLDALLFPSIRSQTIPLWALRLTQFQIGVAYFYGGLAKINYDWLNGQPMKYWLSKTTDFPLIGEYFTLPGMGLLFSYSGLLLDLLIVPFLIWKRTRIAAFIFIALFHVMNSQLFVIGIFPWFMLCATTLFFRPDWCRPFLDAVTNKITKHQLLPKQAPVHNYKVNNLLSYGLTVFVFWQLLFPFRHYLIPGNVNWTEEGHRFSWHMKLRTKSAKANFYVHDVNSDKQWKVDVSKYLTTRQEKKMIKRPDMIFQFAHYLDEVYKRRGYEDVIVRAKVGCKLNRRERQLMIDPNVDLSAIPKHVHPASWILPLTTPLESSEENEISLGSNENQRLDE